MSGLLKKITRKKKDNIVTKAKKDIQKRAETKFSAVLELNEPTIKDKKEYAPTTVAQINRAKTKSKIEEAKKIELMQVSNLQIQYLKNYQKNLNPVRPEGSRDFFEEFDKLSEDEKRDFISRYLEVLKDKSIKNKPIPTVYIDHYRSDILTGLAQEEIKSPLKQEKVSTKPNKQVASPLASPRLDIIPEEEDDDAGDEFKHIGDGDEEYDDIENLDEGGDEDMPSSSSPDKKVKKSKLRAYEFDIDDIEDEYEYMPRKDKKVSEFKSVVEIKPPIKKSLVVYNKNLISPFEGNYKLIGAYNIQQVTDAFIRDGIKLLIKFTDANNKSNIDFIRGEDPVHSGWFAPSAIFSNLLMNFGIYQNYISDDKDEYRIQLNSGGSNKLHFDGNIGLFSIKNKKDYKLLTIQELQSYVREKYSLELSEKLYKFANSQYKELPELVQTILSSKSYDFNKIIPKWYNGTTFEYLTYIFQNRQVNADELIYTCYYYLIASKIYKEDMKYNVIDFEIAEDTPKFNSSVVSWLEDICWNYNINKLVAITNERDPTANVTNEILEHISKFPLYLQLSEPNVGLSPIIFIQDTATNLTSATLPLNNTILFFIPTKECTTYNGEETFDYQFENSISVMSILFLIDKYMTNKPSLICMKVNKEFNSEYLNIINSYLNPYEGYRYILIDGKAIFKANSEFKTNTVDYKYFFETIYSDYIISRPDSKAVEIKQSVINPVIKDTQTKRVIISQTLGQKIINDISYNISTIDRDDDLLQSQLDLLKYTQQDPSLPQSVKLEPIEEEKLLETTDNDELPVITSFIPDTVISPPAKVTSTTIPTRCENCLLYSMNNQKMIRSAIEGDDNKFTEAYFCDINCYDKYFDLIKSKKKKLKDGAATGANLVDKPQKTLEEFVTELIINEQKCSSG